MAYYREARLDEVVAWLVSRFDGENIQIDAETLAAALLDRFDILTTSKSPT